MPRTALHAATTAAAVRAAVRGGAEIEAREEGRTALMQAARAGADTLVLERAGAGGGTSAMSGGVLYLGGGTSLQKACGFDDSPEDMFRYLMASCGPSPDEPKMRLYCEGSVEHYEWRLDGALVGGASLEAAQFLPILDAGRV